MLTTRRMLYRSYSPGMVLSTTLATSRTSRGAPLRSCTGTMAMADEDSMSCVGISTCTW